jgi:hypothetical protein
VVITVKYVTAQLVWLTGRHRPHGACRWLGPKPEMKSAPESVALLEGETVEAPVLRFYRTVYMPVDGNRAIPKQVQLAV